MAGCNSECAGLYGHHGVSSVCQTDIFSHVQLVAKLIWIYILCMGLNTALRLNN